MNNIFLEGILNYYFEGRLNKKESLKNQLEKTGFNDLFSKAAQIIMERTKRNSSQAIPGGLPFTIDDIIFILNEVKHDPEFIADIKTPKQLADKVIELCFDIINIAHSFVENARKNKNYKGKLAYELSSSERKKLADSIKVALQTIWLFYKKRVKIENSSEAQTLSMNKIINYINSKGPEIEKDLRLLEKDLNSANAKIKAEAISNLKKLNTYFNTNNAITFIREAFNTVKKYSGSESLIWPTLTIEIKSGDKYASLFEYLDAYKAGKDIEHAKKWLSQFKNKTKQEIKEKILTEKNFRNLLKETVKAHNIDKIPGSSQTIKNLQKIAAELIEANPEYIKHLQTKTGSKEAAIDEIISLLAGFIRVGALEIQY